MSAYPRRFYTPPGAIGESPRVRKAADGHFDFYSGTKEDLAAIGLLPQHLFPGEPEMPGGSARLWPHGAPQFKGGYGMPGSMTVRRTASGKFQIRLAVSLEERERREEAERQREKAAAVKTGRRPEALRQGSQFLACAIERLGLEGVSQAIESLRRNSRGASSAARTKLPAGWQLIECQRPGGAA